MFLSERSKEADEAGNYLNFINVLADSNHPERWQVNGGLSVAKHGTISQIQQHKNPLVRAKTPSFHCYVMEIPSAISVWGIPATYPKLDLDFQTLAKLSKSLLLQHTKPNTFSTYQ